MIGTDPSNPDTQEVNFLAILTYSIIGLSFIGAMGLNTDKIGELIAFGFLAICNLAVFVFIIAFFGYLIFGPDLD